MSKRERKRMKRRMLRTGERRYAWYSPQMEAVMEGHCVYLRPDGKKVKATLVSESRNHECGWDDMKYLGKVIGFQFGGLVGSTKPVPQLMIMPEPPPSPYERMRQHIALTYAGQVGMPNLSGLLSCTV